MESDGLPVRHLKPGECYAVGAPVKVCTVLGSCVSVTMFHAPSGFGGISHAVLPSSSIEPGAEEMGKFVDTSLQHLSDLFWARGIRPTEVEVKVFGGADVLGGVPLHGANLSIGRKNVETTWVILRDLGMKVIASDVGGDRGRKLIFLPHTGEVWIKRLRKMTCRF